MLVTIESIATRVYIVRLRLNSVATYFVTSVCFARLGLLVQPYLRRAFSGLVSNMSPISETSLIKARLKFRVAQIGDALYYGASQILVHIRDERYEGASRIWLLYKGTRGPPLFPNRTEARQLCKVAAGLLRIFVFSFKITPCGPLIRDPCLLGL